MLDEATRTVAAKGVSELAQFIWESRYVPEIERAMKDENALRSDPFAEGITYEVFGEELRMMTPRDLVALDGFDNNFVTGGEVDAGHVISFLWELHRDNYGQGVANAWRRGRFNARVGVKLEMDGLAAAEQEIAIYMRRVLFDLPSPDKDALNKPPPPVNCIAGLIVDVAASIGFRDPFSGALLADTPIPRLVQYRRSARPTKDHTGVLERAKVLCMDEVNSVMAEFRAEQEKAI